MQLGAGVRFKSYVRTAALAAMAGAFACPVAAQNGATVNGGPVNGAGAINSAAGNNNQQANVGVLAIGDRATAVPGVTQHLANSTGNSGDAAVSVQAGAFAQSSGWLAVNGTSGNDNQQANIAAFEFAIEAGSLADTALSQTRASTHPTGSAGPAAAEPDRSVAIGDGAFEGSSGLVQVNLVAGDRNSTANSFAMSVSGPAGQ